MRKVFARPLQHSGPATSPRASLRSLGSIRGPNAKSGREREFVTFRQQTVAHLYSMMQRNKTDRAPSALAPQTCCRTNAPLETARIVEEGRVARHRRRIAASDVPFTIASQNASLRAHSHVVRPCRPATAATANATTVSTHKRESRHHTLANRRELCYIRPVGCAAQPVGFISA